jgi:cellulose biosynthesis protein BcsQ
LAKIVVINTKGGVGKSTISVQIGVTYLYAKTRQRVDHFEFDDENQDAAAFYDSSILNIHHEKVGRAELREKITDTLIDYENVVIDVGANKTATKFLDALIDSGMLNMVDLIIIPLMDGENDATSAANTYFKIREANKDVKIIFALNRVNTTRDLKAQFNIFLGDPREVFNNCGIIESILPNDRNYIQLTDSDTIKYSKNFGKSVWELAKVDRDLEDELKKAIIEKKDKKTIKLLSFKTAVQKDCKKFTEEILEPVFKYLSEVIELDT